MSARKLKEFVANNGAAGISTLMDTVEPLLTAHGAVNESIEASNKVEKKHSEVCKMMMQFHEDERRLRWQEGSMESVHCKLLELYDQEEDLKMMWRRRLAELTLTIREVEIEEEGKVMPRAMAPFMEHVSMAVQDLLALVSVVNELLDSGLGVRAA